MRVYILFVMLEQRLKLWKWGLPKACADPESFVRGGPILTALFLVYKWRDDPNNTISGPRWHADDGTTLNVGLVAL